MSRYTLKVYPAGQGRSVYRIIEISGKDTLDTLCEYIVESFDFIHEHLYEFCMDNKMYSDDSYQFAPEDDSPSTDIAIDKIRLVKGQKFSLHYDYGDDWMFTIHVQNKEPETVREPAKLLKSVGNVDQYDWEPNWEEWIDDGEE